MSEFKPHIGKNVIETLTLGMYEDSRFIYREYVQNAADQIDVAVEEGILEKKSKGEINITIEIHKKCISVEDNATGIRSEDVLHFLGDVANSQKDRTKRKGFRGIGRLGGLGYCKTLVFETSYKGENVKSKITLNANQLREIIEDKSIKMDAAAVISVITTLEKFKEDVESHYFKVKLNEVTNEELLDVKKVTEYLSMVAPVPFKQAFPFTEKIHSYFYVNNIKIEEYDIHLNINNEKLHKPYKIDIYDKNGISKAKILDVSFFKIRNEENELIAIGWYGVSDLLNFQIHESNIERGIRLRKDNIGIGSEITLSKFFGQFRQNLNYIGEVHAISPSFIPNARRDYFNDNKTTQAFEKELKEFFASLGGLTQESSKLHNRKKDILLYKKEFDNYQGKIQNREFTKREKEHFELELKKLSKKAFLSKEKIDRIRQKSVNNENLQIIYDNIIDDSDFDFPNYEVISTENIGIYPITLTKLNENEKLVVEEIFSIIKENLPLKKAEMLVKKIAEHFN